MTELIYLAGPYSHPDQTIRTQRAAQLSLMAGRLMQNGYVVFSPISHGHAIAQVIELPTDFAYWQKHCHVMLSKASRLTVLELEGWRQSVGVREEINLATQWGLPIEYLPFTGG